MPAPEPENVPEPSAAGRPDRSARQAAASQIPAPESASTLDANLAALAAAGAVPEGGAARLVPPLPGPPGGPPGRVPTGTVRLLVKALSGLPDAERDEVYVWLLGRAMAGPDEGAQLPGRLREVSAQLLALQNAGGPSAAQTGQQIVPVRFSADQHAQLRAWCTEHGFSMATVIRGLVVRFLEGQLPAKD